MANAIPVHAPKPEAPKKPAPPKDKQAPVESEVHLPAAPGQTYKTPDGTVVEDH